MRDRERIKYLFNKYLDKTANADESNELFEKLKEVNDPDELNAIYQRGWEEVNENRNIPKLTWDEFIQSKGLAETKKKRNKAKIFKLVHWSVAASVLVLVGIAIWTKSQIGEEVFETGIGEKMEVVLDDGTKVILGENSRLIWDENWQSKSHRSVSLSGQAYFDVSHVNEEGGIEILGDDEMQLIPFKVLTSDVNVNVLGTAFEVVNRYEKTDVFLERGKVELDLLEKMEGGLGDHKKRLNYERKTKESVLMDPGDFVSFSSTHQDLKRIHTEDPLYEVNLNDGVIFFDNIELGLMLEELGEIYDKKIVVRDSKMIDLPVSFGFPYENWETVISLLELTLNVETEIENDVIIMDKKKR
ncbi:FecR family protein [Membranihabitans marinus]|uniref:FecR family protein n=1 Tax=Membranihabitans marinus TaxID=1227546 RepID=UPI001F4452F3|nr:FecR domain-containing protein [Membranihabitans marinus]